MALNEFRGDPRGSARSRRAAQQAKIGPVKVSAGAITTTGLTADTTLNLDGLTQEIASVNGSTTITGFDTLGAGQIRRLLFEDSPLLVYNATSFILPGNSSIQCQPGDVGEFESLGDGNWRCYNFSRGGEPASSGKPYAFGATTAALATCVYDNGHEGVGATLTASANGALSTIDGQTMQVGWVLLVKDQADTTQNGLYDVTGVGSVGTKWVLTRSRFMDSGTEFSGALILVVNGTTQGGSTWICQALANATTGTIVVGAANVLFLPALGALNGATNAAVGVYGLNSKGVPLQLTISQTLDLVGSTRGMIPVRGATTWGTVSLGSTGLPLVAGATDPAYAQLTVAGIADKAVTLAKHDDMATASLYYRKTAGAGAPEVNTLATLKTDLNLTGTNSGDQTITLTGGVTGSGAGSFVATVVTNANLTGPITSTGNATAVATTFAFPGQSTPSATGGQVAYDTTIKTISMGVGAAASPVIMWAVGVLFVATASVSSSTTAETKSLVGSGVGTMTIPAGMPAAGCVLRLRARGAFTMNGTGTFLLEIKLGATVVAKTPTTVTTQTNKTWELDCDIVFRVAGSSGSVLVQGDLFWFSAVTLGNSAMVPMRGNDADPPSVVTVDTTAGSLLVDLLSVITGTGTTFTCNMVTLERLA